jgi:hypothetical protein
MVFIQRISRKCASCKNNLFYATEVQKMRIFKGTILSVSLSPSGGWVEGESILFTNKNIWQKVVDHLPPIHLREVLDAKHRHKASTNCFMLHAVVGLATAGFIQLTTSGARIDLL